MVRVLTILSSLHLGGVEVILYNYLKNMDHTAIQMDIIVHNDSEGALEEDFRKLGCKIYRVTPKRESIKKNTEQIGKIIKNGNYDVVHSRMNYRGISHMFLAKKYHVKTRIIHNHIAYTQQNGIKRIFIKILKRCTALLATDWFACSVDAGIDMFGYKAVNNEKVVILKNAIEVERYRYSKDIREKIRTDFQLEDSFVIGNIGRFHEQKNHLFLLEIFREIVNKKPDSMLLIVGDGELESRIRNRAEELDVLSHVIFAGARKDVPELLSAMDVFLFPTRYEGFGNVLIEAQANGLQTICSAKVVPESTNVSDVIEYVFLDNSANYWAEKVINCKKTNNREAYADIVRKAGFDVKDQAFFLQTFYLKAEGRSEKD